MDVAVHQLSLKLQHELLDHLQDHRLRQRCKADHRVQTVAEFRGEGAFDRRRILALATVAAKADGGLRLFACACVRGHDQDHIAEVHCATVVVRQRAVVHHLQQNVVHIRVCLFDFIEQEHTMRMLVHPVGQLTTLIKPNIARRRADQTGNRVFLHIFGHVKAQQFYTQRIRQLFRDFGFTHAGWASEQIIADGLFRFTQASPRQFDSRGQCLDCGVLPKDHALERFLQILENLGVVLGNIFRRDARDFRHNRFDFLGADGFAALGCRDQMLRCACLVDHVDGFVGQLAVVDVTIRQLYSGFDRIGGVFNRVMLFEVFLQTLQDLDGIWHRRLVHVDFLETTRQRAIFFEVLTEFFIGRGPHRPELAAL